LSKPTPQTITFAAGAPIFYQGEDPAVNLFDATDITNASLARQTSTTGNIDIAALKTALRDKFAEYISSQHPANRPETRLEDGRPIIFTVGVYYYDGTRFHRIHIKVRYEKNASPEDIDAVIEDNSNNLFYSVGGSPELKAVYKDKVASSRAFLQRYSLLRQYEKTFINAPNNSPMPKLLSVASAVLYLKQNIMMVSAIADASNRNTNDVSKESDCLVLSPPKP
jgi:hypothetical protein